MKIPFKWEDIFVRNNDGTYCACTTWRAKVIGGWLICNNIMAGSEVTQGMVFIPDKNHEWEIE